MARIYLTGRLAIEGPKGIVDEGELPGVQGRVALASLVMARGPISRVSLANTVWGETSLPAGWDKALNSIISKLRAALACSGVDGRAALVSGSGAFELRRLGDLEVDVEQCTTAVDAAEGALRHEDIPTAWANAAIGTSIARRPFLAGVYSDRVVAKREAIVDLHYRALDVLAGVWDARGEVGQAVSAAEELTRVDRLRERGYRRLIELHGAAGDAASAQRVFVRCREELGALGVEPSARTMAAVQAAGGNV